MSMHLKHDIPHPKASLKSHHPACKICRAPHEICGRCQAAKNAAMGVLPRNTRRGRPRATLVPGYR